MPLHLPSRRRQIAAKGRAMVLQRQTGVSPVVWAQVQVRGVARGYRPEQLTGDIRQGDQNVSILNDEIAAAGWPGPPKARDSIIIDGRTWAVEGAYPVYEGDLLIGHDLWVRGG